MNRHKNKPALQNKVHNPASISVLAHEYLVKLTRSGLYGHSPNDVARALLYDAIRRKVKSGEISPIEYEPERHENLKLLDDEQESQEE